MKITIRRGEHTNVPEDVPRVLLDADVLFELATRYKDNTTAVHTLYNQLHSGDVLGYSSPVSVAALFSLLRRCMSEQEARKRLDIIHSLLAIATTDSLIIDLALASRFERFDDAIQYYSAIRHEITIVISRSTPVHSYQHLRVISPEQFVKEIQTHNNTDDMWETSRKQIAQARVITST